MSLFNRLFSVKGKTNFNFSDEPAIFFGSYSDNNKTKLQYEQWDRSLSLYKDKKYLDAYELFFNYLEDKTLENVSFIRKNNRINFEFIQGSKIIKGSVNDQEIYAEAEVVRFEDINIPVMRKLLRQNYHLYYSKFVIKNDVYSLKYFSPVEDAKPGSLYKALRELATEADLFDDILTDEFDSVHPINIDHIQEIPEKIKQVKLKYFRIWLSGSLQKAKSLDNEKDIDLISYILQNLLFKIYYLLAPEGSLLSEIRYFQKSLTQKGDHTVKELNLSIIEALNELNKKTDEELAKSLYRVDATFAVNKPTSFNQIKIFIQDELLKAQTCINEKKKAYALEICEYILSYSSITYGMSASANNLMQVVWHVLYPAYFNELGFQHEYYSVENSQFNIELSKAKINNLISNVKKHKKMMFKVENLDFTDKLKFIISFFNEFQSLNYD